MIKLINDYVIDGNERDYVLKIDLHKQDKKGNDLYKVVGYYGSVSTALQGCYKDICRKMVKDNDYTIKTAWQAFKEVENAIQEIMPKEFV